MVEKLTLGDKLLFVFLLSFTLYLFKVSYFDLKKGHLVTINVNNKEFGSFPLSVDRKIDVTGPIGKTTIVIKNGRVKITKSPCTNKMCIRFGWIKHMDRFSICLPNKIVIKILGDDDNHIDAVVG